MSVCRSRISIVAAAALGLLSLTVLSCGGGGSPSSSTPPTTVTPQPTPTPPIGGGGGVGSSSCPLGPGTVNATCVKGSSRLQDAVYVAIDTLVQQKPQIFDKTQEAGTGTGQYRVLDREAYLNGTVANLTAAGFCAQRDPDDFAYERIQAKNESGFSETFDILSGDGFLRTRGIYKETCTPASFPVDRTGLPPGGSGCGTPYPEPIARMTCKLHLYGSEYYTLDSTAQVGPDPGYCSAIGYTDGRSFCPVRKEGSPERPPCEEWRVGHAQDTGRTGPTWTINGQYCTGPASGCANHPDNQYALLVYRSGSYKVCAQTGKCCEVIVEK
jgi:hypothetical protein